MFLVVLYVGRNKDEGAQPLDGHSYLPPKNIGYKRVLNVYCITTPATPPIHH